MKRLTLKRFAYTPMGTFGSMVIDDNLTIYTVEDAWRENASNVSCIPVGTYQCSPRFYNRGGYPAIHIKNVPGRSHILIHRGNTELDVQGCVVTGMKLGFIKNRWAVADSRTAFDLLSARFGDQNFELEIVSYNPDEESYLGAGAMESMSASPWHRFGVITSETDDADFIDVAEIKPSLKTEEHASNGDDDSPERRPFSRDAFAEIGVQWHGELGYFSSENGRFLFVPSKIDSQRSSSGEPLCSLMPMGEEGYLNMASVLSPSAPEIESLRNYLEAEEDKDVSVAEIPLSVRKAMLVLTDRSGAQMALTEVKAANNAPHTALMVAKLSSAELPLVSAAFAGEKGLLHVRYDIDFSVPLDLSAELTADTAELREALVEKNLWRDDVDEGALKDVFEELIAANKMTFICAENMAEKHRVSLKAALLKQLYEFALSEIKGDSEMPMSHPMRNATEKIELQRRIQVAETIAVSLSTDVAEWRVGNVLFE